MRKTIGEARQVAIAAVVDVLERNGLVSDRTPDRKRRLAEYVCNGLMGAGVIPIDTDDALELRDRGLVPDAERLRAAVSEGIALAYAQLLEREPPGDVGRILIVHCASRDAFVDTVAREIEKAATG